MYKIWPFFEGFKSIKLFIKPILDNFKTILKTSIQLKMNLLNGWTIYFSRFLAVLNNRRLGRNFKTIANFTLKNWIPFTLGGHAPSLYHSSPLWALIGEHSGTNSQKAVFSTVLSFVLIFSLFHLLCGSLFTLYLLSFKEKSTVLLLCFS